jgi:hypothetical protein
MAKIAVTAEPALFGDKALRRAVLTIEVRLYFSACLATIAT